MIRRMNKTRLILFGSVVAAALVFGGVVGAAAAHSTFSPGASVLAALSAASPSPSSNENATHEAGESAAQEQAENNGTFHPGGPGVGGHPCGGHSNEDATHEKSETAAQEAAENAACPTPAASPSATK